MSAFGWLLARDGASQTLSRPSLDHRCHEILVVTDAWRTGDPILIRPSRDQNKYI